MVAMNSYSPRHYISISALLIFLVPFDDRAMLEIKFTELMENQILRIQMGAQARDSVIARYSPPSVIAKWEAIFLVVGA